MRLVYLLNMLSSLNKDIIIIIIFYYYYYRAFWDSIEKMMLLQHQMKFISVFIYPKHLSQPSIISKT